LCSGIVIDLSGMNGVAVGTGGRNAQIGGGVCAAQLHAAADPLGLAAVTGSCGSVGVAGFAMGGGYGPLTPRFGLGLDNVLAAEVVLADGRIVTATHDNETELFWALRGGGGNFGVVTAMQYRLHELPGIRCGLLLFPFSEARAVLQGCADIAAVAPDELTAQCGVVFGPDGNPVVMVAPTWCGLPEQGEAQIAPFFRLGTLLAGEVGMMSCGERLKLFAGHFVNGQRVFFETCWLPKLGHDSINVFIQRMAASVSPGCGILTHEFRGAASRVPEDSTAFGLRRDHMLIEILATFTDRANPVEDEQHQKWARATRGAFDAMALPGGYPNFLLNEDPERVEKSFGRNAGRLVRTKRHYDPDGVFSAIPLPVGAQAIAAE
jgi:FAD/FMN-containing dehydrogenase